VGAITLKKVQHKLAGGTGGNCGGDWGQENGSGATDNRSSELPVLLPREVLNSHKPTMDGQEVVVVGEAAKH
jgi:hypothetical protein